MHSTCKVLGCICLLWKCQCHQAAVVFRFPFFPLCSFSVHCFQSDLLFPPFIYICRVSTSPARKMGICIYLRVFLLLLTWLHCTVFPRHIQTDVVCYRYRFQRRVCYFVRCFLVVWRGTRFPFNLCVFLYDPGCRSFAGVETEALFLLLFLGCSQSNWSFEHWLKRLSLVPVCLRWRPFFRFLPKILFLLPPSVNGLLIFYAAFFGVSNCTWLPLLRRHCFISTLCIDWWQANRKWMHVC